MPPGRSSRKHPDFIDKSVEDLRKACRGAPADRCVTGRRQTARMNDTRDAANHASGLTWVKSMGGPLIAVPVSALHQWGGCTEDGMIVGDTDQPDDYDRACAVEGYAEVISLGVGGNAFALVLGDEPATTCYLPEQRIFLRWLAADSATDLLAAAGAALRDPATRWEDCGHWDTDGPAVLMDSAWAGKELGVPLPGGGGQPAEAPVHVDAGRWRVRAFHKTGEFPWVGVVQLLPEAGPTPGAGAFRTLKSRTDGLDHNGNVHRVEVQG